MISKVEDIYCKIFKDTNAIEESGLYTEKREEFEVELEKFKKALTEEQQKNFDYIYFLACQMHYEQGLANFKEGFKLGMHLAIETFK